MICIGTISRQLVRDKYVAHFSGRKTVLFWLLDLLRSWIMEPQRVLVEFNYFFVFFRILVILLIFLSVDEDDLHFCYVSFEFF